MLHLCRHHSYANQPQGQSCYRRSVSTSFLTRTLKHNIDIGDGRDDDDADPFAPPPDIPGHDWLDLISDANSYLSLHLLFTYLFTGLTLYFIYRNYQKFIRARQLFSLELVHSIAPRTVMVTRLPPHLRGERALAEYFENMNLSVESVSVCREVDSLKELLDRRTKALLELESAWVKYLGNPSRAETVDTETQPLVDIESGTSEEQRRLVVPNRKRPTLRPGWFKAKVDALEYLNTKFEEADEAVLKRRRTGKFKASPIAFVTFEKMSSAVSHTSSILMDNSHGTFQQIAVQTAHAQLPGQCVTYQAPEPRDIIWSNMGVSSQSVATREWIVLGVMVLLLFFWFIPVTALAGLLSYKEIKKTWPALARLIDANEHVGVIVQNSLPSVAMITLNACLPFLLEGTLCYILDYCHCLIILSRSHLPPGISRSQLDRVFAAQEVRLFYIMKTTVVHRHHQIFFIPPDQRRVHFPLRKHVLATGPRPCQLSNEDSREAGRSLAARNSKVKLTRSAVACSLTVSF